MCIPLKLDYRSMMKSVNAFLKSNNFESEFAMEQLLTITSNICTNLNGSKLDQFWSMILNHLASVDPQILRKYVQSLREKGVRLSPYSLSIYRKIMRTEKMFDLGDDDLRSTVIKQVSESGKISDGVQTLLCILKTPKFPTIVIDQHEFENNKRNVKQYALDVAIEALVDHSLSRRGDGLLEIVATQMHMSPEYMYQFPQLRSILTYISFWRFDGKNAPKLPINFTEVDLNNVPFDFVAKYKWQDALSLDELDEIGFLIQDIVSNHLRKKSINVIIQMQKKFENNEVVQNSLNNLLLHRLLSKNFESGFALVLEFANQTRRPFELGHLAQINIDVIPVRIRACAEMLNSECVEKIASMQPLEETMSNRQVLRNLAFSFFHVLSHKSQYLTVEDFEYLSDRFKYIFGRCSKEGRTILANELAKNAAKSNDLNLAGITRRFLDTICTERPIDIDLDQAFPTKEMQRLNA